MLPSAECVKGGDMHVVELMDWSGIDPDTDHYFMISNERQGVQSVFLKWLLMSMQLQACAC